MLKKRIKYTDFNDRPREEDYYFNLTKAELLELELSENGLQDNLQRIAASKNGAEMIRLFKAILEKAYLEIQPDGSIKKGREIFEAFSHTEAYSELVMEIMTDADKLAEFVANLVRGAKVTAKEVREQIDKGMEEMGYQSSNVFDNGGTGEEKPADTGPRRPTRPVGPTEDPDQPPLFTV